MLQKLTTSTRHRVAFTRRERRHKRTQDRRSRYYFRTLWNNCSLCGKFEIIRAPIRKKVQFKRACDERLRNLKIAQKHKFSDSESETRQMLRTLAQSQSLIFFHGVPKLQERKWLESGVGIKHQRSTRSVRYIRRGRIVFPIYPPHPRRRAGRARVNK